MTGNSEKLEIRLWRALLSLCGVLALFLAVGVLLSSLLVLTSSRSRETEEQFLRLSRNVGLSTVAFYLLSSAGQFLSNRSRVPKLVSDAKTQKQSWISRPVSIQPLLNAVLCFGIGCAVAFYGVHVIFQSTLERNSETVRADGGPYLGGAPSAIFFFEPGKAGNQDTTEGMFRSYGGESSLSGGTYTVFLRLIAAKFKEAQAATTITSVDIIGYADSSGNLNTNQGLSEKRAQTIRTMLLAAGIPETIVSTRGAGATQRACAEKTKEERKTCLHQDRRVEVFFRGHVKFSNSSKE